MKDNVLATMETLRLVLSEINWASDESGLQTVYCIGFGPPHAPVSGVVVGVDPDTESFIFLANFFPHALTGNREALERYITRTNWNLTIGSFEMNCDDGGVRFRLGLDFTGSELSAPTIRHVILSAMKIIEEHSPSLCNAMAGCVAN